MLLQSGRQPVHLGPEDRRRGARRRMFLETLTAYERTLSDPLD
ncbi:hypothetical protein [Streptomyces narbonensis]|nr:hypothetical protein [Streptomyces narbonensis]